MIDIGVWMDLTQYVDLFFSGGLGPDDCLLLDG